MPPNDERNAHSKKLLQKFLETKKLIKVLTSFFFRENPSSFQRLIQRPKRCRAETEKIKRSSIIFTVSRDKFNKSDQTCKMWTLWGFLFDRTNRGLLMNDVTHFPFSSFSRFKISMANNILYWTDPILKMKSKDGSQWFSIFFSPNEYFHFAEQLRPQNAEKVLGFLISSVESELLGISQACHFFG